MTRVPNKPTIGAKLLLLFVLAFMVGMSSCGVQKDLQNTRRYDKKISEVIDETFTGYHFGCRIQYLNKNEVIYAKNDTLLFTPASNTKVLTFIAALKYLGKNIPWIEVVKSKERTVLLPLGDPTFLHPYVPSSQEAEQYFDKHYREGDTVWMSFENYYSEKYGPGWSWDDANYNYQAEISPFPIHGNIISVETDSLASQNQNFQIVPDWHDLEVKLDTTIFQSRERNGQDYTLRDKGRVYELPVTVDSNFYAKFFKSKKLHFIPIVLTDDEYNLDRKIILGGEKDSVLKYFMKESDNFIAEQLLLSCAQNRYGLMNNKIIRNHLIKAEFEDIENQIIWRDGSGLSRYNQISPYAMVTFFSYLNEKLGTEKLTSYLATAGEQGTIEDWYIFDKPRVFAKTGTLSNVHNLSGLVLTKKNNWILFSFMNNHFRGSSQQVKKKMQKTLQTIIEHY